MAYLLIFLFSILDHIFTWRMLILGTGEELNPIMNAVMLQPFWLSFFIKNGWTALLLAAIYFLGKKIPQKVRIGLNAILIVYVMVIGYHLYGIWS